MENFDTKTTTIHIASDSAIPMDENYEKWAEAVRKNEEYEARNRGRVSCYSDGSIEKYIGNGSSEILIPGDVMLEAVKIALKKIKEEEDNA